MQREQTDPLRRVLFGLSTPVFVIDRHGSPFYANRAAADLLGKGIDPRARPEDLANVYQARLAGTDEPYPTARMPIVRALSGESCSVDDMVIERPGGGIRLRVDGSPILGDDGQVEYAVACFRDITRECELEEEVYTDALTGALNRPALERDLSSALGRIARTRRLLGLVFLDLNGFKLINDRHGHVVGDQVLCEFTRRLRSVCRGHEQPYRYGGDEFVMICEDLDDEATVEAIRSRVALAVAGDCVLGGLSLHISAAVGASSTRSPDTPPARLLVEADARMYRDKVDPSATNPAGA